ncbi:hypothetical protein [Endozoicomonas sp. SESOKO2]|uniref:hypothetical protein n=3 Tax=unclassified Endozoicomonas TaxID=2644528 RepID=UPI0021497C1F|nr:hypothetical protein [Endozoicomonas sp. SESOKO2]
MIMTALSKSNKSFIHLIILSLTMMSGCAFALNERQKSILKQLTLQEYEELDRELKEKDLYRKAKAYINSVMININRRKRIKFFKNKSKEIAEKIITKPSDNTTEPAIPYTVSRTFNLVQAMIHYGKLEPNDLEDTAHKMFSKNNRAVTVVTNYANRLLLENSVQVATDDTDHVKLFYEDRYTQETGTRIIKAPRNEDFNFELRNRYNRLFFPHREVHLIRNGNVFLTDVNIIRKENLNNGDKIIYPNKLTYAPASPTRNSASKAREIYMAVGKLQAFLDKKYPDKFKLTINDNNMFLVSLDFVAPYGWWKDAFFRIEFNFDNIGNEGPEIDIKNSPKVANLCYSGALCLIQSYKHSKRFIYRFNKVFSYKQSSMHYGSQNFSVEEQILNIINYMAADFDIRSRGIILFNFDSTPQEVITKEIIRVNTQAQKVNTSLYVESDHDKIKESVHKRIKDGEDPDFDYLVIDDEFYEEFGNAGNSKSISTDIFIPVEMYRETEIVKFDLTSIKAFSDLIYEARRKSGFRIPNNIEPVVYYNNEKIDKHNFQQALKDIRKENIKEKRKEKNKMNKNHNILTMIIKVPGYERRAFKDAAANSVTYYVPDNSRRMLYNETVNESEVAKPIKWEIHLVEEIKIAKANNMLYQYKLILPFETQKTTERYRGGAQYGSYANIWIPSVRDNMSDVEKKFALMSMYDLSKSKLRVSYHLKKAAATNLGNNIITKALLTRQYDKWLPTQDYLDFLLQRVEISLLINREDYSIAKENNVIFENIIDGNIDENIITDLTFFIGHLAPSLRYVSSMNAPDKAGIIYRIVINYLIEICVRTLLDNEFDASTGIVEKLIDKPGQFTLEDIYAANIKDISVAFNLLQVTDFLFTKIIFNILNTKDLDLTVYDHELESLQINIDSMRKIVDNKKNLFPLFLNHLFPVARLYSDDLDFGSNEFSNKFMLNVLKKYESRTKNKDVKASLHTFLKITEQNYYIFSKEKTDKLISLFRKNTPELLINVPSGQGSFRQTCCHCREIYETKTPIRGKGCKTNKKTGKPKEIRVRPFHKKCMEKDRCIKKQANQLYKEMEKGYPKKQLRGPDYHYNPVPDGFELIRVNGDGNCMYSSIAEIFNRNGRSGQADVWNQQTIRQIMDYNLRQIYSTIQNHPDKKKMMQQLQLLLGIDADMIPAVLDNNVITDSASFAESELAKLQQFGDAQLITLLVPTQGVWFPVITQGDYGPNHEIYDLNRWVNISPNLLTILLQNKNYTFPDLSESQRATLLELLLNQKFDQAALLVSRLTIAPHHASAYLIHYPSSAALLEHFDAAVRPATPQNTEADSSVSTNNTDRETLQDRNPLSLMIQTAAGALLITTDNTM